MGNSEFWLRLLLPFFPNLNLAAKPGWSPGDLHLRIRRLRRTKHPEEVATAVSCLIN